jgi:hypothetical protein
MLAGSQIAHALAYRFVYPDPELRQHALAQTGHGYVAYTPFVLSACGGIVLVSIAWLAVSAARNRRGTPVPAWAFALLPLVGFATQEAVERALAGVFDPWSLLLEPTLRVGLLLQVPFAFAVFVLAWLLLRVAEGIGARLRSTSTERYGGLEAPSWFVASAWLAPPDVLAAGHAGRGPPVPSLATA